MRGTGSAGRDRPIGGHILRASRAVLGLQGQGRGASAPRIPAGMSGASAGASGQRLEEGLSEKGEEEETLEPRRQHQDGSMEPVDVRKRSRGAVPEEEEKRKRLWGQGRSTGQGRRGPCTSRFGEAARKRSRGAASEEEQDKHSEEEEAKEEETAPEPRM